MQAQEDGHRLDPGPLVAQGFPLTLRVSAPLWVVNATQLPVSAGKAARQSVQAASQYIHPYSLRMTHIGSAFLQPFYTVQLRPELLEMLTAPDKRIC